MSSVAATPAVKKALVVGAGAVGLRTALELLQHGVQVELRAPVDPRKVSCSMGAGGLWMPFHCDDSRVEQWSMQTLNELYAIQSSNVNNNNYNNLVEILPAVCLIRQHKGPTVSDFATQHYERKSGNQTATNLLPFWSRDVRLEFQHLTVEMMAWQNIVYQLRIPPEPELVKAGYNHAYFFRTPIVNTTNMLGYLLNQVKLLSMQNGSSSSVDVETNTAYKSIDDMRIDADRLGCDAIVNCTGLGSRDLLNDHSLVGARGILLHFDRSKCVRRTEISQGLHSENIHDAIIMAEDEPWGSDTHPCYMIPRGDTIVVGGTYLEGDLRQEISAEERERLLHNATLMGIDVTKSSVIAEWTGFRPSRPTVRCEVDAQYKDGNGPMVAHNYGMGGSGWTVNVGAAKNIVDLILAE